MERRLNPKTHKMVILAEGSFGILESKAATVLVRYLTDNVVAVIDSTKAGKDVGEVIGIGTGIPIVGSLAEAMALHPTMLSVGIAPPGGELPPTWQSILREAIEAGLHIMSGLHWFLSNDSELANLAERRNVILWDVRKPPANLPISTCKAADVDATVVLTVGSDCRVGKMVVGIELANEARNRGLNAEFCPTGQNGMMVSGWGIAVDAVVSDFTAGATEQIVIDGAPKSRSPHRRGAGFANSPGLFWCHVEPAARFYAGRHDFFATSPPGKSIARYTIPLPSLGEMIAQYEILAEPIKPAKVIGIALNCFDLTEKQARETIELAEREAGLPATDVIRYGPHKLVDAIISFCR